MEMPERTGGRAGRRSPAAVSSLTVLHLVTGAVILWETVPTLLWARGPSGSFHLLLLASAEAGGALLFLVRRTLRLGGAILLASLGVAIVAHGLQGELAAPLMVYAAAVLHVAGARRGSSPRGFEAAGVA